MLPPSRSALVMAEHFRAASWSMGTKAGCPCVPRRGDSGQNAGSALTSELGQCSPHADARSLRILAWASRGGRERLGGTRPRTWLRLLLQCRRFSHEVGKQLSRYETLQHVEASSLSGS